MAKGEMRLPTGATPEQIARFGHIAARLRAELDKRGWNKQDFNRAMGRSDTDSGIYVWLAAKGAPGKVVRPKISAVLKIPEADLMPRDESTALMKVERAPRQEEGYVPPPQKRDVLSFTIDTEGHARIRCDVTLPAMKGASLLQILLNAGLAMTPETDDAA